MKTSENYVRARMESETLVSSIITTILCQISARWPVAKKAVCPRPSVLVMYICMYVYIVLCICICSDCGLCAKPRVST